MRLGSSKINWKSAASWIASSISAYLIVQITVDVQLGVAIAYAFLVYNTPLPLLTVLAAPLGIVLVIFQYPLALSAVRRLAGEANE